MWQNTQKIIIQNLQKQNKIITPKLRNLRLFATGLSPIAFAFILVQAVQVSKCPAIWRFPWELNLSPHALTQLYEWNLYQIVRNQIYLSISSYLEIELSLQCTYKIVRRKFGCTGNKPLIYVSLSRVCSALNPFFENLWAWKDESRTTFCKSILLKTFKTQKTCLWDLVDCSCHLITSSSATFK